ncbi:hypothetical protein AKJ40_00925 [candidate division MSBL1 archaeon SCGC-AAA259M10]|uniref:Uncharacterized protein n=2 Tax=candidate division MSBL1 TaxID=215777 RepID=A0A133UNI3_9EURY|nr:hypothetical protein AKJ38_04310 [candidate division MSBL1 archaeon SCGC-AAA259I14]KXB00694.1 hypothetical protein AKJ40_00925 [candidate division MSBL1 archaeon SCGC-AAA259M10]
MVFFQGNALFLSSLTETGISELRVKGPIFRGGKRAKVANSEKHYSDTQVSSKYKCPVKQKLYRDG